MPRIFVAGSFVVGLTIGVQRMPVIGETLIGDRFDLGPGGKGTNQAIAAARLGAKVDLLAAVGKDLLGQMALDLFRRERIPLTHIHRMPQVNTAVGVVHLLPDGQNWIVGHLGANMRLTPEHVDVAADQIAASNVVLAQNELPLEVVRRALELGRQAGVMTIWNPAPAPADAPKFLADVDLLTPNETELRLLQGLAPDDPTPNVELAERLLARGVKQLVVTCGTAGCLIVTAAGTHQVDAVAVTDVVDTTGAGDAFNAALAVGLAEGMHLRQAVRQATGAGAYAVGRLGVIDGLATRSQLDAFMGGR